VRRPVAPHSIRQSVQVEEASRSRLLHHIQLWKSNVRVVVRARPLSCGSYQPDRMNCRSTLCSENSLTGLFQQDLSLRATSHLQYQYNQHNLNTFATLTVPLKIRITKTSPPHRSLPAASSWRRKFAVVATISLITMAWPYRETRE